MRLKLLLIFLISLLFISCKKSPKKPDVQEENIEQKLESVLIQKKEKKICENFSFLKWEDIYTDREKGFVLYEIPNYKVKMTSFLNEKENTAGELLIINDQQIDTIENEFAHKAFVYTCSSISQIIIFIEESDESGSFAYRVYHNLDNKFIYSGTLNIAPNEDTVSIKDFIKLEKSGNELKINLLTSSFFDSKNFKSRESNTFNGAIVIDSGKLKIKE